jgi:uncharacterized protein (DUF427 family)
MKRESVWDYPRPAICEPFNGSLKIIHDGAVLARTVAGHRTLETSHPPTYYFPPEDVAMELLEPNGHQSYCEWKGVADYFDLRAEGALIRNAAWRYHEPTSPFSAIRDHLSFYASKVDACFVNDEQVRAQAGDFYGGWITANLVGPFKGAPGTSGW